MSHEPGETKFRVDDHGVDELVAALDGFESLTDAFQYPAAILASVWRRMLATGVIAPPQFTSLDRVEVVVLDANVIELRMPVDTTFGELMKTVSVFVQGLAGGDLANQVAREAARLAQALEVADSNQYLAKGPQQKPHN